MAQARFSVLLLTAAPTGMGAEAGGAYVKVDGREALLRSVELFLNRENVKQVRVVFLPDDAEECRRRYGPHLGLFGVKVVTGGPRWLDQIAAGLEKLEAEATHVIVHDAARPAVGYGDIDALMEAAGGLKGGAVALTTPVRSALVEVDEGGGAMAFCAPARYLQLLTPMAFTVSAFKEMAEKKAEPHASQFKLIKGSPLNVRVGGPGDAGLVKSMIAMLPKPKLKAPTSPFEEAQW